MSESDFFDQSRCGENGAAKVFRFLLVLASTVVVWASIPAAGHGQTAADYRAIARATRQHQIDKAKTEAALATGVRLFGADHRCQYPEPDLRGTLYGKSSSKFGVGDWGCTFLRLRVTDKVSKTECLVMTEASRFLLVRGLDMSEVADDMQFILQHRVVIRETYSYTSVDGAARTVLVLERDDSKVREAAKVAEDPLFITWTDSTGEFSVVAKFIEFKGGNVHLEARDSGKRIEVAVSRLSNENQKWVRDELKRRKTARSPSVPSVAHPPRRGRPLRRPR